MSLDPRETTLRWFADAKFGMFIHYGLYSLLGRGEWVQYHEKIPIVEYARLKDRFTAKAFDASAIADLAVEAGMKYITFVCKHCDSFCLWDTAATDFNSMASPANRDLVREMATACKARGLGFFPFYEHGFDWRHPHGPAPWEWSLPSVRPHYDPPDPWFAPRESYDFDRYLQYVQDGISELCSAYGEISGMWLDGVSVPLSGDPAKFRIRELYQLIRKLQPQALICYKHGVYPELEDFMAPEYFQVGQALEKRGSKPMEVCRTMQKPNKWGYVESSEHLSPDEVMGMLAQTLGGNANLLLNIGPLGDGSVHPEDIKTLKEVGRRIRADGFPRMGKQGGAAYEPTEGNISPP